jgi:riboflavin synthase
MFTGLVQSLGHVNLMQHGELGIRLTIHWPNLPVREKFAIGESIAINGCCLTIVSANDEIFVVEAGPETLARTTLKALCIGDKVNLERALCVGDRLGGHFVQGHIDTTAAIIERRTEHTWVFLQFQPDDARWLNVVVEKGSIAVDGVSLTVVDVDEHSFSVMLIPHTIASTTLGSKLVGNRVNLETDMLAKHVQKLVISGYGK